MEESLHVFRIIAILNVINDTYTEQLEKEHRELLGEESLNYIKSMNVEDVVDFVESLALTEELRNNPDFTSHFSTLLYCLYQKTGSKNRNLLERSEDMLVLSANNKSPRSLFILGNNQVLSGKTEEGLANIFLARNLGCADAHLFGEIYKWHIALVTAHNDDQYRVTKFDEDMFKENMIKCAEGSNTFDLDTLDRIEQVVLKTNEAYKKSKYTYGIFKTINIDTRYLEVDGLPIAEFIKSTVSNSYIIINEVLNKEITEDSFAFLINEPIRLDRAISDLQSSIELASLEIKTMHHC